MHNLSLTVCSFLLKKKHTSSEYYFLNKPIIVDSDEDETVEYDLEEMFKDFFKLYADSVDDTDRQKSFHCEFKKSYQGETDQYKYLYCVVHSGAYGSSSEVTDKVTGNIKYKIAPDEPVEKPFYFYIVIPKDNKRVKVQKGIFLFQNVGPYGVKTLTTDFLKTMFSNNYNITLECRSISPKLFLDRMITQQQIHKLILIRNCCSRDDADTQVFGYGEETRVLGKLHFLADGWIALKNKINRFAQDSHGLFEINQDQYNNVKVVLKIGGHDRTVNLHNLENLSIIEPIPDNVRMANGHANRKKLLEYLEGVVDDYLHEMVLQVK